MRESIWPAVFLALVAGFIDALGYLVLAHLFTAHMSGNAAALGAYAGQHDWGNVVLRALPIPAFVLGGAAGAVAVTIANRRRARAQLAPAFGLELLLLIAFQLAFPHLRPAAAPGTAALTILVSLLAAAMGVQAATLRRVGDEEVNTSFVTGMLVDTVEECVAWAFERGNPAEARRRRRHAGLFAAIFFAFMIGAVAGSVSETRWGENALFAPMLVLAIVITEELWHGRTASASAPHLRHSGE